ncbi:hypothetical protein C6W91_14900 [Phaeobacter sp. SYSU ZJ3003]
MPTKTALAFIRVDLNARSYSITGRSLLSMQRTAVRTEPPLPFRVFADAASACRCGTLIAALQRTSPGRSFKATAMLKSRTVFFVQPGSIIKEADKACIRAIACNSALQPEPVVSS